MKRTFPILTVALALGAIGYSRWRAVDTAHSLNVAREEPLGRGSIIGRNGAGEANYDIARGAPRLLLYGRERVDAAERELLLKQRFGVSVDPMEGCIVNQPLIAFADSYNATVQGFVAARFGPAALAQANSDAWEMWLSRQNGTLASQSLGLALASGASPEGLVARHP
jgi:hypothetical protein